MATKTQIGAVIGIDGAKEYKNQLKLLVQYTKEWKSETEKLTSSFDKNFKSLKDVNKQRESMERELKSLNNVLALQKQRWGELATTMLNAPTDKEQLEFSKLRTEINNTEIAINNLNREIKELPADTFRDKIKLIRENLSKTTEPLIEDGKALKEIGTTMTKYVTLPLVAGATLSVKAAVDWESALNGVRKTTDMTADEMSLLETELKRQALTTTYSSTELANLAQIAGQLGVRGVDDISKFVQVVSDLGISTDMTAEEAATDLARIFNITEGGNLDSLEKIGSVIVHLGNNLATTEPEITAMANRMASAASIVGFTTSEIFALSGALTSVGITAEAGGSTVGQVLTNIDKQFAQFTKDGTGNLEKIAEISGMSADQFASTWKNEPVKAFEAFINGLAALDDESENINVVLDELDMAGIRQSNMLKALAQAQAEGTDTTKLFTEALRLADEAYVGVNENGEEFNALEKEASVRRSESATSFANLTEALTQLGQAIGEVILPVIIPFIKSLTDFITKLSQLPEPVRKVIVVVAGLLAALGPVLAIAGQIMIVLGTLKVAAATLGVAVGALTAPIALVVAGIVGFIAFCALLIAKWDEIKAAFELGGMLIQEVGRKIGEFFSQIVENVKSFIGMAIDFVLTGLLNLVERIVAGFLLFVGSTLPNFVNGVVNGFKNMVSNIKNTISNTVQNIKDTFSNLISSAWNWGSDLIGNIVSGIQSRFHSLLSSVKNIANTIWSYLHFSEPEVGALSDFNSWMPDMMKGLAKGIDDNIYLVDNAISRVADSLASPNQVNYGGVVINLNVPQGANGQQIVDEIENELASRTIRRRAVFG